MRKPATKNNSFRAIAVVFISTGPAGILAVLLVLYHTITNKQVSEFGFIIPAAIFPIISMSNTITEIRGFLDELTLFIGLSLIVLCSLTVPMKKENWTTVLAIDAHLMTYTGLLITGIFTTIYLPIILIILSTTIWVIEFYNLEDY